MKGGRARFVNHSCAPNCFAELVGGSGERESGSDGSDGDDGGKGSGRGNGNDGNKSRSPFPRVLIRAAVDLRPGEEITYDYCLSGEPELGGGGGGGRAHDLHHTGGGSGSAGEVVRCSCGAPACRGVL